MNHLSTCRSIAALWLIAMANPGVGAAGALVAHRPADGGGEYALPAQRPCLTPVQRGEIRAEIEGSLAALAARGLLGAPASEPIRLDWPLSAGPRESDPGYHGISGFVDQDPFPGRLLDYQCGSRTYDLGSGYNHRGTDYFSWPFAWTKMERDEVEVVAPAAGMIIYREDSYPDRSCGFGGTPWNAVYLQHADGSIGLYGHLKTGSATPKGPGEKVAAGEYLGIVGSSGNSTGPHLHMELWTSFTGPIEDRLVEPYAGPCNVMNAESWWRDQRPYYDSAINKLATHWRPPQFLPCPQTERPNLRGFFAPGELATFAAYYRDQRQGRISEFRIYRPDGESWHEWSHISFAEHYSASYWYWTLRLPNDAETGTWRFEVVFLDRTYVHPFEVGHYAGEPGFGP